MSQSDAGNQNALAASVAFGRGANVTTSICIPLNVVQYGLIIEWRYDRLIFCEQKCFTLQPPVFWFSLLVHVEHRELVLFSRDTAFRR